MQLWQQTSKVTLFLDKHHRDVLNPEIHIVIKKKVYAIFKEFSETGSVRSLDQSFVS